MQPVNYKNWKARLFLSIDTNIHFLVHMYIKDQKI